uniref:CutA divalent cation tolerance homolog n=1 Tax=Equus caballus TaxID=9796 RepID=A0A9L0R7D2_HORSE
MLAVGPPLHRHGDCASQQFVAAGLAPPVPDQKGVYLGDAGVCQTSLAQADPPLSLPHQGRMNLPFHPACPPSAPPHSLSVSGRRGKPGHVRAGIGWLWRRGVVRFLLSRGVRCFLITCLLPRAVVEKHLAACVNLIPKITSIYEWKGKIEEDSEVLMMIKTQSSLVPALTDFVRSVHPYEVAEVIALPVEQGNIPYLNWVRQVTVISDSSTVQP